jgi:hypothetical protein
MSQVVVIGGSVATFTATCELCTTTFAGRLDEDLEEGVFLCREGHAIRIVRSHDPPSAVHAAATAA